MPNSIALERPQSTTEAIGEFLHFTAREDEAFTLYFQDGSKHPIQVTKRTTPLPETVELICNDLADEDARWCIYSNITNHTDIQLEFDMYAVAVESGEDYQIEEIQPITDNTSDE